MLVRRISIYTCTLTNIQEQRQTERRHSNKRFFFREEKNLRGLSPQAYTDLATAACRRSYCQILRVEGVAWSAQRILTAVILGFLDRSRYFFFQVAPQLSSQGWVDPVPDPLLLRKSDRVGNRTRALWICSQKLWPLDHRGGPFREEKTCKSFNNSRSPIFTITILSRTYYIYTYEKVKLKLWIFN
jgi:hypothetical protein